MSERAAPRKRASRRALRAWAWVVATAAFVSPWAAFASNPKPAIADRTRRSDRPVVIVRRITRRVVIRDPVESAGVRYVYTGGGSSSSSSGGPSSASGQASTSTGAS